MHSKTVRRRRALLIGLVVLSIILLTAYFGESPNGGLHAVQRDFLTVVSPIQDGANTALKPVRSVINWFGEVLHAKGEVSRLRAERDRLRSERVAEQERSRAAREATSIADVEASANLAGYKPVSAEVVFETPSSWYSTVDINKGSSEGIAINDAVYNGEGLVGVVTQVAADAAQVSLITDSEVAVAARIAGTPDWGIVQPKVGDPSHLVLQFLHGKAEVVKGDIVDTSGMISPEAQSLYPAGIPIGTVTSIEESAYTSINIRPAVELHSLDLVRVLTEVPGARASRVRSSLASLPSSRSESAESSSTAESAGTAASYAQSGGGG